MVMAGNTRKVTTWDAEAKRLDRIMTMEGPYRLQWEARYGDEGDLDEVVAVAPLDGAPGVVVEFVLRLTDGEIGLGEQRTYRPDGQSMSLNSEMAIRLRLTEHLKQIERDVRRPSVMMTMPDEWCEAPVKVAKRPGSAGHGPLFYAQWARRYVDAVNDETRELAIYKHLGALEGERPETIAQWIMKARQKGLLTKTGQGKRGGELTDRGKRLLAGHDDEEG